MRPSTLLLYCPPVVFGQASAVIIPRDDAIPSTAIPGSTPTFTSSSREPASFITPPPSAIRSASAEWTGLNGPCEPACVAQFPAGWSYGWQRAVATKTITVAMAAHMLWSNGTTDFRVLPAKLLSTLRRLPRNAEGTMIAPLQIGQGVWGTMTTTLAYPTAYTDYPLSYWWSGVLPTRTANRMVCSTALTQQEMAFSSHPSYDSVDHSGHLSYPKEYLNGSSLDGAGFVFARMPVQILNFYEHAFPSEAGFSSCSELRNALATPEPVTTSEYITITRTVLVEPAVYRQPTVTESLEAPTPLAPGHDSAKSAISTAIPIPIAAHEDTPSLIPNATPIPALPGIIPLPPLPVAPSSVLIGGASVSISIVIPSATPQPTNRPSPNSAPQPPVQPPTPTIIIAGQTATPGQTLTINNKPVTITERGGAVYATTPDQAPILLLAPAAAAPAVAGFPGNNAGAPSANRPGGDSFLLNPAPGLAVRPIAINLPAGQGTTGPLATFTPIFASMGGGFGPAYLISGQTIAAGRGAVTLGSGASATVMSLATDSAGEAVLDVNGVKTTLPAAVAVVSGEDGLNSFAMFPVSTALGDASGIIGNPTASGLAHNSKTTASPSASSGQLNTAERLSIWIYGLGTILSLLTWWA